MMNRYSFVILLVSLLSGAAFGQSAGDILWSVDLAYSAVMSAPVVGPDGTIYVHAGAFYAIAPDGSVRWSKPLFGPKAISVGPDGTVYAGGSPPDDDIFAYTPDGDLLWVFAEPDGGQGLMAGPTVGPDGNIYAITDLGGLGALSLTPDGNLRWNVTGFGNFAGTGQTAVPLGADRLYFAEDVVPGCAVTGVASVDFGGNLDWCIDLSGVDLARPVVPPNGNAYITSGNSLYNFAPDGHVVWSHSFPIPGGGMTGPGVGPDNSAYLFQAYFDLWALDSGGNVRWFINDLVYPNFPAIPVVSQDNSAMIVGTAYSFGQNGSVFALSPVDGSLLWSTRVTGTSSGVSAPAVFSADGQIVYVPVTSANTSQPSRLIAMQVHDNLGQAPVVSDIPDQVVSPGGKFKPVRADRYVADPDDPDSLMTWSWSGNTSLRLSWDAVRRGIRIKAPTGWTGSETVLFTATDPDGLSDSDPATFTVSGALTELADGQAGFAGPVETALVGNYPEPFNPTTTIRYSLANDGHVLLRVYDVLGRLVTTLVDADQPAGFHNAVWGGRNSSGVSSASGIYLYRITTGDFTAAGKMLLAK